MLTQAEPAASRGKAWLRRFGIALSVLCMLFVVRELWNRRELWERIEQSDGMLWTLFVASAFWIGSNVCLGLGWRLNAASVGAGIGFLDSAAVALRSQIGKYLPGNVFHFAGRVWLARRVGVQTPQAVFATTTEVVLLVIVASGFGISAIWHFHWGPIVVFALQGLWLLGLVLALKFLPRLLARFDIEFAGGRSSILRSFASASAFYAISLLLQTAMFLQISGGLGLELDWSLARVLSVVSFAWVAGFVVVGAPGGLGVREAVFAFFALSIDQRGEILLVASLMRLCSIIGDALSFLIAVGMYRSRRSANESTP